MSQGLPGALPTANNVVTGQQQIMLLQDRAQEGQRMYVGGGGASTLPVVHLGSSLPVVHLGSSLGNPLLVQQSMTVGSTASNGNIVLGNNNTLSIPNNNVPAAASLQQVLYPSLAGYVPTVASPAVSLPTTYMAIDAETGRPVRVLGQQPAPVASAVAPAALGGPRAQLYRPQPQPQPQIAAPLDLGASANLLQKPAQFLLDPTAPIQDLASQQQQQQRASTSSPSLIHDAFSFSASNTNMGVAAPAPTTLEELAALRNRENASLLAMSQQQKLQQSQLAQLPYPYSLNTHIPAANLARHQMSLQQLQYASLPVSFANASNHHLGSSSTPQSAFDNEPRHVVPQNMPDGKPGAFPAVLFCEADEERLTNYQCLLRKNLELFEADEEDAQYSTRQGRTAPIKVGQVGLRCRHCSAPGMSARTKGASYYSQTIEGIYQIAQNMSKVHLCEKCQRIPPDIKHKLNIFRTDCRRAIKGKEYWSAHIRWLGVYEDHEDGCLRVRRPSDSSAPSASPSSKPKKSSKEKSREIADIIVPNAGVGDGSSPLDAPDELTAEDNAAAEETESPSDQVKNEAVAESAVVNDNEAQETASRQPEASPTGNSDADSDSSEDKDDDYDLSAFKRRRYDEEEEGNLLGEVNDEDDDEDDDASISFGL